MDWAYSPAIHSHYKLIRNIRLILITYLQPISNLPSNWFSELGMQFLFLGRVKSDAELE